MARKNQSVVESPEAMEDGASLLSEFSADVAEAGAAKAAAKAKAPKTAKVKAEKPAKPAKPAITLDDVIAKQENNPFPWVLRNILELAERRVAVSNGTLAIEDALTDVASMYVQLAADAVTLSERDGFPNESSFEATARLIGERFAHQLPRLGKVFGQPAKPAPYVRAAATFDASDDGDDN